jgi:Kelch motif protein/kelch motif-containing protein
MRMMKIRSALLAAAIGLAFSPLKAADLATHLFPHKDGEADPNSGGNRDSVLRVGNGGSVGWITYQTGGTSLAATTGSSLTLYLDTIYAAGTLKVFALDQAITLPETDVEIGNLDYDNMSPIATIALTSADQEKIIRLNLNTLLSGGTFHGLVLESSSGLDAEFGSKDCHAQPLIELRYAFATSDQVDDAIAAGEDAVDAAAAAATSAAASGASASAAATSAAASASSATASSSSATSAANSAAEAAFAGQIVLSTVQTAPGGYSHTGIRAVFEKPWMLKSSGSARYDVASAVYNGKLYIGGGYNGSHLSTFEAYDPSNDTWSALSNLPEITHTHALCEVGGKLYSIGGIQDESTITGANFEYNPSNDTWNSTPKAAMPRALGFISAVSYGGKIHVFGGATDNGAASTVNDHYAYDPSNNTWDTLASLGVARCMAISVVVGSKIHVIGGYLGSAASTIHEVYNPSNDTWDTLAALPAPMYTGGAVARDGKIYLTTNADGGPVYQYDTELDSWVKLADNITPRFGFGYGLIGNNFYIALGRSGGSILGTTEAYELPRTIYYLERN